MCRVRGLVEGKIIIFALTKNEFLSVHVDRSHSILVSFANWIWIFRQFVDSIRMHVV